MFPYCTYIHVYTYRNIWFIHRTCTHMNISGYACCAYRHIYMLNIKDCLRLLGSNRILSWLHPILFCCAITYSAISLLMEIYLLSSGLCVSQPTHRLRTRRSVRAPAFCSPPVLRELLQDPQSGTFPEGPDLRGQASFELAGSAPS